MGWMTGVQFPTEQVFSLRHNVQTDSGAHPASYPRATGVLSSGVKRPGREADHSPPSSAEVKNPPHVFMAWCLVKHQGQRYLLLYGSFTKY
jgi:hypothetical protein